MESRIHHRKKKKNYWKFLFSLLGGFRNGDDDVDVDMDVAGDDDNDNDDKFTASITF